MKKNNQKSMLNEVVVINGSKVIMENGTTRVEYNDRVSNEGYMPIDEAFDIIEEEIRMIYASQGLCYIKKSN